MTPLFTLYEYEKRNMLESCIECGICIKQCPVMEKTALRDISPQVIQKEYIAALNSGILNDITRIRIESCMECYRCMEELCPKGLRPMLIHEMLKQEKVKQGERKIRYNDQQAGNAYQRILASIQVPPQEYSALFKASGEKTAEYVFFPGCNVYFQPEKIQEALDVMSMITDDYAFVPGLEYCCGDNYMFMGDLDKGENAMGKLVEKVASYAPKALVLWCPTCQCRFQEVVSRMKDYSFEVLSFPQFAAQNLDKLSLKHSLDHRVTLHEPCKSAFLGLDNTGVRDILKALPGIEMTEMARHGKNTSCCGSGAVVHYPESFEAVRDERLREAADTNAELLVDVCHFCHLTFVAESDNYDFSVVNYVSLLAESLGIGREDKFSGYVQLRDVDRIMDDAQEFIETSPFSEDEIRNALKGLMPKTWD